MKKPKGQREEGAPKVHVGNPHGKNQYTDEPLEVSLPVQVRLYSEDFEEIQEAAKSKPRGFLSLFIREVVRDAIAQGKLDGFNKQN